MQGNVDFITFTKKYSTENFIFVCSGQNNLSLLICFQCHYSIFSNYIQLLKQGNKKKGKFLQNF